MPLWNRIKKYRRRFRLLSGAKKITFSVYENKKEYMVLIRGIKKYFTQKGNALRKGKVKWHK